MKTFPKLFLLTAAAALVAGPIVLQAARSTDAAGNPRHPALRRMIQDRVLAQQIARRLHLTAEQKTALDQVRSQARDEIRSIRADQNLTPAEKRAKAREAIKVARQEARTKLLEPQREKLDKLRQRLRERRAT
jgi:Spy/CpxP family protein refolding chaperone